MSKITFRADDDLVAQLEAFDASKSEVMREALRAFLKEPSGPSPTEGESASVSAPGPTSAEESLDDLIEERVDAVLADRLGTVGRSGTQDVNITLSLADAVVTPEQRTETGAEERTATPEKGDVSEDRTCAKCGETVSAEHVYCPNCGEKASHRVFCECGDELRSDWAFCPSCGRRTAAADVLDQ
ncbi:double zinc ribbon domain-containing protein [Halorhabdus rudnickae]|uniref:double zinc ribbon domain-containing protein n=1 Tax=Halorhabdus rudnickae TaxID=1775544 RepID=UPI00108374F1|nr:zinc ribbon domain-containing protein [Halorhabdus rudnickae]